MARNLLSGCREAVNARRMGVATRYRPCPDTASVVGFPELPFYPPMTQALSETDKPTGTLLTEILDFGRTIGIGLVAATTLHAVLFQPFTIPSSSMEPGLVTGDYIVVSKFAYGWSRASLPFNPRVGSGRLFGRDPAHGDVVVFRLPRDPDQTWIKRVIGLPGDWVQVSEGVVFVNGVALEQTPLRMARDIDDPERVVMEVRERQAGGRERLLYDTGARTPGDDIDAVVVPKGAYFVMGDHRDNSLDSRWPAETGVGLLPAENVMGRAEVVVASWKPGASLFKPWTWLNLRTGRLAVQIR